MGRQERDKWHEQRSQKLARMNELHKTSQDAGKPLAEGSEELRNYTQAHKDVEELDRLIDQDFKQEELNKKGDEQRAKEEQLRSQTSNNASFINGSGSENRSTSQAAPTKKEELERGCFRAYLSGGREELRNYLNEHQEEMRAQGNMTAGSFTQGGAITAPKAWSQELLRDADRVANLATKVNVLPRLEKAESLGKRRLSTKLSNYAAVAETTKPTGDQLAFTGREMTPHGFGKIVPFSRLLLQRAEYDVDSMVRGELFLALANTKEDFIVSGTGAGQPLGLMVASSLGVSTGRDITTLGASAVDFDTPLKMIYKVPSIYLPGAEFYYHSDVVLLLRLLKTATEGIYHWQESPRAGEPDRLHGYPVVRSDSMPNTVTTGLYTGLFGNLKMAYDWLDAWQNDLQRLEELYAETNEVAILHRVYFDGAPMREEAVARQKQA